MHKFVTSDIVAGTSDSKNLELYYSHTVQYSYESGIPFFGIQMVTVFTFFEL